MIQLLKNGGTIITFYSFKGGVGRSMAVANIGALLVKRGLRVLCVDFDLEAPGLDPYFSSSLNTEHHGRGLLDLLIAARDGQELPLHQYVSQVDLGDSAILHLMTCGLRDDRYAQRVLNFHWSTFFAESNGGSFFERLRDAWRDTYDYVLIDSRTG